MPKNITTEVRDIILKVKEFMDEEKRMQVPIIPLSKVYVRVSAATGRRNHINNSNLRPLTTQPLPSLHRNNILTTVTPT